MLHTIILFMGVFFSLKGQLSCIYSNAYVHHQMFTTYFFY